MKYKADSLPESLLHIIRDKGTERPFTGEYDAKDEPGTYLCRQCGLALYRSKSKFNSSCGWPSFDQEIASAVTREADADGRRTEILCKRCKAHLGHVFEGERLTPLNTRHCVNSASLDFVNNLDVLDTEEAILAAGCFWGVEYYFKKLPGILKVESGYTGGNKDYPTYEEVCDENTGHVEAIRVVYDPSKTSYEKVVKYFFEIHDPTQADGQGPDLGEQYLSRCFYYNEKQKRIALQLISELKELGYNVVTKVLPVNIFWPAEKYHQDYYQKSGKTPYCHRYTKRFGG
jgi:peptide methionine sulfoxide reductase msrA/msrB